LSEAALIVDGVVKSYGPIKALDGASLSVTPGEFVALLGPNGAGKTTLFQLLTGLFVADGGTIRIDGHDIRRSAVPALAGLGIVFQQPTLDLDLSVSANLRFHARLHGMGGARTATRIAAELARLGLAERANDKVRQLSGGTKRRVELARALLHEPHILLMDEPTVGLDPASRRDLLAYVRELCRDRRLGVLWATHLVEEVEQADKVVVLHRGKVLKTGTPAILTQESGKATLAEAFLSLTAGGPKKAAE
jgi:ABC-2 type transport system ATP-binding protein